MEWLKRLTGGRAAPLRGVPAVRRQKNYSAASGYAYEYFFEGWREEGAGWEYVFSVSGDRKRWFAVPVLVEAAAVRGLQDNERYGVVKMALFRAFDERASPAAMDAAVRVRPGDVQALMERLGLI